ncbi:MAG: HAMP domain-containing sensor histidine kinase [Methylococcales bacterium]
MIDKIRAWTLRKQLNTVFFIGIVLLTTSISTITQTILSDAIMAHTIRQWEKTNADFIEKSKLPLSIGSRRRADEITHLILAYPSVIKAGVYDLEGNVLAEKGTAKRCFPVGQQADKKVPDGQYELKKQWCFKSTISMYLGGENRLDHENRDDLVTNKPLGSIHLWFDKRPTEKLIQKIFIANILIALTIMAVVFVIVRQLGARVTQPINALSEYMMQAEQGAAQVRAEVSGPSDIKKMFIAFNAMMERIELNEKTLENQVHLRTRELTEAYRSAQSATEFKSQILATLSHEMRTPLHGTSCYIQLAQEEPELEKNPQLDEYLNDALRCTSDLTQLITQLLDYSKNAAKKIESTMTTFLPNIVLINAIKTVSPFAKINNNTIRAENLVSEAITTDKEKFSQIILNLLNNAIKFTENGTIKVRSSLDDENYIVSVEDNGCGISKDNLTKIFEAFWQADRVETRTYRGIGIGLAISKQFCEIIGAEIRVRSQVGQGSTFSLLIPPR